MLVLVVLLKSFQRLGYLPKLAEVPALVVVHVGRRLGLGDDVIAAAGSVRTLERYRGLIRDRVGVTYDPEAARKVAEEAIRVAAQTKDNPADLINVALVKARYELPGYTTLDEMAGRLRAEVNHDFFLARKGWSVDSSGDGRHAGQLFRSSTMSRRPPHARPREAAAGIVVWQRSGLRRITAARCELERARNAGFRVGPRSIAVRYQPLSARCRACCPRRHWARLTHPVVRPGPRVGEMCAPCVHPLLN